MEVVNTGGISTYSGVLRGKEDTRDYMSNLAFEEIEAETHRWQIVKVDSNRMIQGYIENTAIDFKLLGYTVGSDPSYFTVPPDITPVSSNQWTTVDVSNLVDSDADGVVLLVDSISGSDRDFGIQEVGAQQTTANEELEEYGNTMWLVGLSDSKHFVARLEDTNVKIYLVAQTKGSVVYYVTDMSVTNPPTGFWQTMDADDYGVLAAANGLIFRAFNSSGDPGDDYKIGLRHGDSTDDWNGDIGGQTHFQAAVGLNNNNEWYMFVQSNAIDVWIAGYTRLVRMDVHADIDVLIRDASDNVTTTLDSHVAITGNVTDTNWQTFTITYAFPGYTVVDPTDYLEIDLFADATLNISEETASLDFRIDDPTLAVTDQMGARQVQIQVDWWGLAYGYREQLTVTTGASSPSGGYDGYTVRLASLDTAAFVSAGKMRSDCNDLRIVWRSAASTWTDLDRHVLSCDSASTDVRFQLQATLGADVSTTDYYLYYGNSGALAGPAALTSVYLWYDSGAADQLSSYTLGRGDNWHGTGGTNSIVWNAAGVID